MKRLFILVCLFAIAATAQAQKVTFQLNYGMYSSGSNLLDAPTSKGSITIPETLLTKEIKFDNALSSYGGELTVYILKGWGVNAGYAYSNSSVDEYVKNGITANLAKPEVVMHQFNLGVAKKIIAIPLFSLSGIAGVNLFTNKVDNIIVASQSVLDKIKEGDFSDIPTTDVSESKFGLDLGLNARVAFVSVGLKYDVFRKYAKFGLGIAI
ncbi:MAG: hypothetical protein MI784_15470 [Cytophagales bacterium]|nr:hypothetical protein [Cytophagales bacterium]